MHIPSLLSSFLATLLLTSTSFAKKPSNAILLSNVKTLTLRENAKTAHRRVPAVPQLKCIGGSGKPHYAIDVMRCKNAGSDYDSEDIQWTCTANLPEEFKLGSTEVICEGYDSASDPYVLKGSCGVEYRLLLTEKGEEKYGKGGWLNDGEGGSEGGKWLFIVLFCAIAGWILYSMFGAVRRGPDGGLRGGNGGNGGNGGGGGGGFGGGGWPGGLDDDYPAGPPPPYTRKATSSARGAGQQEGWRPGFWSGALGGAAAGYLAGNRGGRQQEAYRPPRQGGGWFGGNSNAGPSWGGSTGSRSSSGSSGSSTRYESTGFGSTSRR